MFGLARTSRSILGAIGVLAGIIYCGGLVYYFIDKSGSFRNATEVGLGPTLVGLGAIGLLFVVVLLFRVFRAIKTPPSSGSAGGPNSNAPSVDEEPPFDADAVISRYMAEHASQAAPAATRSTPPRSATFGRRGG